MKKSWICPVADIRGGRLDAPFHWHIKNLLKKLLSKHTKKGM
jgi:hypothetical protein